MRQLRMLTIGCLAIGLLTVACTPAGTDRRESAALETNSMQWAKGNYIVNLYDAFGPADERLTHDFGFSALVRYNGKTILFDSGSDADLLKANTEALGIDLRAVDFAVASHAHYDHMNGFDYLLSINPDVEIYFPADHFWGASTKFSVAGAEFVACDEPLEGLHGGPINVIGKQALYCVILRVCTNLGRVEVALNTCILRLNTNRIYFAALVLPQ